MIPLPSGLKIWLAAGTTDIRLGMPGLALKVQQSLGHDSFAGNVFAFRGRHGDLVKLIWHAGIGVSLYAKRIERGYFIWPSAKDGTIHLTPSQLSGQLEGID
ncbi:transposase [Acetobacter senegalensis]|uniref:Transposase n=1 Tax=Acetobacter senegalensis TaxID=446692 RepID=A0A149TZ72_9PROT|nr:IS66 family insertion sequence element accessory protein TnpB [Acetobacter senegalensis]KXV58359.1 transposase [Acetobacter senegalensis]